MRLDLSPLSLLLLLIATVSYASKEISVKHFLGMMQSMVDDSEKLARIMFEDRQKWCVEWIDVDGPFSFDRYKETVDFLMRTDKTNRTHHPLFIPERLKGTLESYKRKARSGFRAEVKEDAKDSYKLFKVTFLFFNRKSISVFQFLCESMRVEEDTTD
ncbi:hypothetical protein PENTCL1PPCAC_7284 [Pristionchus entomophagus]|uniref:Uncharacterized protein n=1 Tax=Pristionchus entomophagus TaxID=358040 RepID=A0AAV5SUS9_9BILA|nr:hypothetical protein PENTCL1PPCAC_7284 [Pristionchus entomophagus]